MRRAFRSVRDFRRSPFTTAMAHPVHGVSFVSVALPLVMLGALLPFFVLLVCDVLAVLLLLRVTAARRSLNARATGLAQRRAAHTLMPGLQASWDDLQSTVQRNRALLPRDAELEALMTAYLNIAMALNDARAQASATRRSAETTAATEALVASRRQQCVARVDTAVNELEHQLLLADGLIRLLCDEAVACHCETGATLWGSDLDDACRALDDPRDI